MNTSNGRRVASSGGTRRKAGPSAPAKRTPGQKKTAPVRRQRRRLWIALGCVAAVALTIVVAAKLFIRPPDVSGNDRPNVNGSGPGGLPGSGQTGGEPVGGRKEDYYTFLLIGKDTAGGGNTDTLILVSYDVPNGQVNMMSIPRDTIVNVPWTIKKINSVYMAAESKGGGLENLKSHVAQLTGVMVDRYVVIEWAAIGKIVKALGGLEFDVPCDMNYDDPYQDLHIHLNKGMQTLTGEQAMAMLRFRKDNNGVGYGDAGRAATQQAFLKAMAKKVLQLGNITKVGEFLDIFMEHVKTDLTLGELTWFATKAFGTVDADSIRTFTMPYQDLGTWRTYWYFMALPDQIVPLINEHFNPYNREITEADLQVVQRNEDGSCYVTNGTLVDERWASPTSKGSGGGEVGGGETNTGPGTGIIAKPNTWTPDSGGTTAPEDPGTVDPADPDDPPVAPEDPGDPDDPEDPDDPTDPADPDDPEDPDGPTDPDDPDTSAEPEEPNEPQDPEDPGDEDPDLAEEEQPGGAEDPDGQDEPSEDSEETDDGLYG